MARVAAARTVSAGGLYGSLWDREVDRMQSWSAVGRADYPMERLEVFRSGEPVEFPDWDIPDWARPRRRLPGIGLRVTVRADDTLASRDETVAEWLEDRGGLSIGSPAAHEFWAVGPRAWDRYESDLGER